MLEQELVDLEDKPELVDPKKKSKPTLPCEILDRVFRFIGDDRSRLLFMATIKRFKPLREERRAVAKETLERLRTKYPSLCFMHNYKDERGSDYYHKYTVRLYRGDPDLYVPGDLGLICVTDKVHGYYSSGVEFSNHKITRFFSPWACAFVDPERHEDDLRAEADDARPRSLQSVLVGASRRVV